MDCEVIARREQYAPLLRFPEVNISLFQRGRTHSGVTKTQSTAWMYREHIIDIKRIQSVLSCLRLFQLLDIIQL